MELQPVESRRENGEDSEEGNVNEGGGEGEDSLAARCPGGPQDERAPRAGESDGAAHPDVMEGAQGEAERPSEEAGEARPRCRGAGGCDEAAEPVSWARSSSRAASPSSLFPSSLACARASACASASASACASVEAIARRIALVSLGSTTP